jgi:hypothetical protein
VTILYSTQFQRLYPFKGKIMAGQIKGRSNNNF